MIELKNTTSRYPDLNAVFRYLLIHLPTSNMQWRKSTGFIKISFSFFTVAGAVLDLHQLP